jgi:hypothetical protein
VPRRGGRWIRDGLPGLAVVGILSGTVALLIHRDWVESDERRRAEGARLASRRAVFARGRIGEVLREAKARMGQQALASAWYSCSPAYSNGHEAVWHLRPK